MRRKLIQIAGSTQLVSLPREWCKKNNLKKGEELEVQEDFNRIIITNTSEHPGEKAELQIDAFGTIIPRAVSAFYKRGVDELRITYSQPELLESIHEALAKDTVGFEILEQTENSCTIKHVAGDTTEFESVLRRVFLLMNTMSEECVAAFRKGNYIPLKNIAFLEEANNRFTTTCMRYINTKGTPEGFRKAGPLYYIVESLENLADQYKYLCQHFSKIGEEKVKIRKEAIQLFEKANRLVRIYSEIFYKLDQEKLRLLKDGRTDIVNASFNLLKKKPSYEETLLTMYSIIIAQQTFEMIDALLILRL